MNTYKATNTTNGKFYIGSTTDFERRKKAHLNSKENYPFQRALRKDPNVFEWEVWSDDHDEPVLEQALLDMWFGKEQCYNLSPTANRGPCLSGEKHPFYGKTRPEHGEKMSGSNNPMFGVRLLGPKNPMFGKKRPECSERIKGASNPMFGRHSLKWWVNKSGETCRSEECPGEGWKEGRPEVSRMNSLRTGSNNPVFGKKWWVNFAGETAFSEQIPGPDWQRGRKWKG